MDYHQHLLKLVKERNNREDSFRPIIEDNNKLYQDTKQLEKRNKSLQAQVEALQSKLFNLEEMTKITYEKGTAVQDNYF